MSAYLRCPFNRRIHEIKNPGRWRECGLASNLFARRYPSVSTRGGQPTQLIFGLLGI